MPVIATANRKGKDGSEDIFNTMEFKLGNTNKGFEINGGTFDLDEFREPFIVAFFSTVYKYQGAEIEEEYNIYDVDKMDFKMLYTVLSRVKTSFKNIHLDHKSLKKKYTARKKPRLELCNSFLNAQYSNGKIYEVTFYASYCVYIYRHARAEIS